MEKRERIGQIELSILFNGKRGLFAVTAATLLFRCPRVGERPMQLFLIMAVYGLLLLIAICDQETGLIPDRWNLLLLVCGMIDCISSSSPLIGDRMAGFFCVSFFLLIITWASQGGIGGGDVKLMAAAGFLCGVKAILQAAVIGFFLAGLYGAGLLLSKKAGRNDHFPLGPFLCFGIGWVCGF